ncbi:MAG: EAL domain-containing protein [Candidatus Gastranaerophilales bacterium]|nr:EAL domain-containing protein [Candidatus Gastranaerophilales bacterium]
MNDTSTLEKNLICTKCSNNTESILDEVTIINHFQPIVSSITHSLVGFESLCRGICKHCHRLIPPFELFKMLKSDEELFIIDKIARKTAINNIGSLLSNQNNFHLFINFDAKLIEEKIENPESLVDLCKENNIRPQNIVIEITESRPCDIDILKEFIANCRNYGFLIAMDDVGSGYSNFDRISIIKPDIIKIDRSIIKDFDKDHNKQIIFKAISSIAKKLGMLLLAEGVETEEEIIYSLEHGADLLQGFYFSRPAEIDDNLIEKSESKIIHIESLYKDFKIERIENLKKNYQIYENTLSILSFLLSGRTPEEFDLLLENYVDKHSFIESLYILDNSGIQVTHSHLNCGLCNVKSNLFKLMKKGESHVYNDYYYLLKDNLFKKYTTDTYLSFLSGNLCKTMSKNFQSENNTNYVLCMNILER